MENKKGLIWGLILGDALGRHYKGDKLVDDAYTIEWSEVEFKEDPGFNEWTGVGDQMLVLMESIAQTRGPIVNCFILANKLKNWQDKGLDELPPKEKHLGMCLNFTLKQAGYLQNPIKSCKQSYLTMGADTALNESLFRNPICGITKEWYRNSLVQTALTNFDSRCVAACLVQSYIIHSISTKIPINWGYINSVCQRVIINQKIKKSANILEFNSHWHIALNYKNIVEQGQSGAESCFLSFIKKLNIGNYGVEENQSYVLLGMVLCIVIVIDIKYTRVKKTTPIDAEYFMRRVREVISAGGDATANGAMVGAIIGLHVGHQKLPEEWLCMIAHRDWVATKINDFIAGRFPAH
jgi:ADP-ribosylglycohydrolase